MDSPNLLRDTRVKVTLVARPLLTPVAQKLCRCEHVLTSRTCVHSRTFFTLKSFAAVREAFSNAKPEKEVQNRTTIHRLETKFRGHSKCLSVTSAHRATKQLKLRSCRFQAVISCNNGTRLQEFNIAIGFVVLCAKGFMCSS
jgi:hypothetical protein